ncbi:hypothetical protein [Sorangium sp. So ce1335]|uniref:hypothetical protein n=1 Tax=Sorangium sp. So ce1335 TaxID=3133335 RepID=UPI003F5F6320
MNLEVADLRGPLFGRPCGETCRLAGADLRDAVLSKLRTLSRRQAREVLLEG